jgi:quinol monooxygenase YgiN
MKQYHAQHAKMIVRPGKRDEVIQLLNSSTELLHATPGCVYYLISITEEPDVVWVSELWASKEAKEALAASPETAKTMKQLMPLIVSVTDRTGMTVVGGFGIQ